MQKDIFEDIRQRLHCAYVSDIKNCEQRVLFELDQMDLTKYSPKDIKELKLYIKKKDWCK